MIIALGNDHGGHILRAAVLEAIKETGNTVSDFGTFTEDSVDYPDYAVSVANAVLDKKAELGVLLCGTGIGISIAANKFKGIRCAHCTDLFSAQMCREHNDANIIALGGRITTPELAKQIIIKYLTSGFDAQNPRHGKRLNKISEIESANK